MAEAEAEDVVVEAEAEAEAEATSSTFPEVGVDAGAERGRPRARFIFPRPLHEWVKGSNDLHERKGSHFFAFGLNLAYIPVAPDSFGATGCPRSRGADVSIDELKLGLFISFLCVLIHAIHL